LEILHDVGFAIDSSIFPVVHDHYGIPNAPRFPHYRPLADGRRIAEFPPSTLPACGTNIPVAGGGYFRLLPYPITAWAIGRINKKESQPAMFYIHPWEIDPEQPRISAPWRSRFRHYQNLNSTEDKLARLLDDFTWAPMSEVVTVTLSDKKPQSEGANGL
jgi:polysaccharide deacetylase family protein (PEP-CTERM system associated)